jgi:hypothetical protein
MTDLEWLNTASRAEVAEFYRTVQRRRRQLRSVIECLAIVAVVLAVALAVSLIGDH